mmetsp:Transcript_17861/g.25178  ORF Transcript_17861/g.25178 Transcript_17861/m.25178 type:complete len:311 (+) Transcript_17861:36-968(+)
MSDHCEEQEMEAEALTAIFDTAFEIQKDTQPFEWNVKLVPIDTGGDVEEEEIQNHVMINLKVQIPLAYPEVDLPQLDIEILKGLSEENRQELVALANEEAENNQGMPAIFAICEVLREWLCDNNVKGLDDASMHAQMMRKQKEAERSKQRAQQEFEAQKEEEEVTQAELEELAVRKRRAEGTPCTRENFLAWKEKFEQEMLEAEAKEKEENDKNPTSSKKEKKEAKKVVDKSGRLTGFVQFSDKVMGTLNLEEIEKAAEDAQVDEDEEEDDEDFDLDELDEELFDDEEDVDFDDLESSDDDDDDDDEIDI